MNNTKAKDLLSYSNIVAIGLWEPFNKKYPILINKISGDKLFKWDFFIKIAIIWCAVSEMKIYLPEKEWRELLKIIEEQTIKWNPVSTNAIKDLNNFMASYKNKIDDPSSLEEAMRFTRLLVGTWIIWNLTEKAKIQDEAEISNAIGTVIYNSVNGYWVI